MTTSISFVKSTADFNLYLANNKYIVANFTASWCGPCQASKPMIDQIYADSAFLKVEVVRVDLDSQQELARKYEITSVPTFLFIQNGQVIDRVSGINVKPGFDKLKQLADGDDSVIGRKGNGTSPEALGASTELKQIKDYVPKGYQILNDTIYFGDFQALNILPLNKSGSIRDIFLLEKDNSFIFSDADSQMLLYVPLVHISRVHSIILKIRKPESVCDETNLDAEECDEETQLPNLMKIWGNKMDILSFDDAAGDNNASHVEQIGETDDHCWYQCKLKYVRFQKVQSLNIFIDGDDEDNHTMVEKIAIVGVSGEEKDHHGLVEKLGVGEEEE